MLLSNIYLKCIDFHIKMETSRKFMFSIIHITIRYGVPSVTGGYRPHITWNLRQHYTVVRIPYVISRHRQGKITKSVKAEFLNLKKNKIRWFRFVSVSFRFAAFVSFRFVSVSFREF